MGAHLALLRQTGQQVPAAAARRRHHRTREAVRPRSGRLGIAPVVLTVGALAILVVLVVVWLIAYAQPPRPVPMDG